MGTTATKRAPTLPQASLAGNGEQFSGKVGEKRPHEAKLDRIEAWLVKNSRWLALGIVAAVFVKPFLEKLTGVHLYRTVPRGIDLFDDIQSHLPHLRMNIIFDVGANIGQSAKSYLNKFPGAKIYCFEPVEATFRQLQNSLRGHDNMMSFKLALGASKGSGKMVLEGNSDMFFLLNTSQDVSSKSNLEEVNLETLDGFCENQSISHIDYLKIDTEGGDFDVLTGAAGLLAKQQIDLVEVEAGMNNGNKRHVPFEKLKAFLGERGYLLFGIYEQVHEWPTKEPHLRRTNPVFISPKLIKANIAANQ